MARELRHIEISSSPELLELAEEIQQHREPVILSRDSEEIAVVFPIPAASRPRSRRRMTHEDLAAFRSAAGSWRDVDVDEFIAYIYERRRQSSRPPIKL